MVDSADRERIGEAREELWLVMRDSVLRDDVVLLVYANKQVRPSVHYFFSGFALPILPRLDSPQFNACSFLSATE